jgi:hypothetical protein
VALHQATSALRRIRQRQRRTELERLPPETVRFPTFEPPSAFAFLPVPVPPVKVERL